MTVTSQANPRFKQTDSGNFGDALFSLLNASFFACIITDDAQQIQTWNPGAEALLGWNSKEMMKRPLANLLPDESGEIYEEIVGDSSHGELRLRKKDGTIAEVELWSSTFSVDRSKYNLFLLHDITEKKNLEKALLHASEREQRRIGQDLHDHLCQHLLGAAFATKALAGALEREKSPHSSELHDLSRLINDAMCQVRDISHSLHPVELDADGLRAALQALANRANLGTECVFHQKNHVYVQNADAALHAYRIAQEAVAVALQQTGAGKIHIILSRVEDSVFLQISDDGKTEGEMTANPTGIGARTLQYRAQAMHGSLTLRFDPAKGTCVTCLFPI